jgi:hypothetical protein
LKLVLITSSLIALGYLALIAIGLSLGYMQGSSNPKIMQVRYVTVASSSSALPALPTPPPRAPGPLEEFR